MLCHLPWTVRCIDLESSPASLETTHLYTAVSSTVGAIITKEPDESNLSMMILDKVKVWKWLYEIFKIFYILQCKKLC